VPDTRRLLIVNADDLGRTSGIDRGVFEAHREGVVTSATLMVGYPAAGEAARAVVSDPALASLGVGLHVTLTGGGPPTLPPGKVPSLVDADGRLPRRPEGLDGAELRDVLAEVRNQLALFRELVGRLPTHLDSHHHSHRRAVVTEAVIEVARRHRLPVRNASPDVRERLRGAGVPTTDLFVERFYGEAATLAAMLSIVRNASASEAASVEVMVHPGRADRALQADSTYVVEREREIDVLTHPEVREAIEASGFRLGSFGDLADMGDRKGGSP
jgi:chitin disaccharide deacetylase